MSINKNYGFKITMNNIDTTTDNNVVVKTYNHKKLMATNNYPLYKEVSPVDDGTDDDDDTSVDEQNAINANIINALTGTTYEELYKNIASFPHITDADDPKNITITYTTGPTTSITLNTDMRTNGLIVSTLSGDVPTGTKLVKKTVTTDNFKNFTVTYE